MWTPHRSIPGLWLIATLLSGAARAEECPCPPPPPPPPAWTGALGAGLAITSGNSDTQSYNAALAARYDPGRSNVVKLDAFYLRTSAEGEATAARSGVGARDELRLSTRVFGFGEVRYLRDRFKQVDYLLTPLVGIGYHVVKSERLLLDADAGVGGAFERNTGRARTSSGSYRVGESLAFKLSPQATLGQSAWGLWKTSDSADAYYHFEASLAAAIAARWQLKVSFADDYKNLPPDPTVKKNDTSLIVALLLKL